MNLLLQKTATVTVSVAMFVLVLFAFVPRTIKAQQQNSINSTGNVGVGTTSPNFPLQVYGGNNSYTAVISNGNDNGKGVYIAAGSDTLVALHLVNKLQTISRHEFYGNGDANLSLGSGLVGIGTNAPTRKLHVVGTANQYAFGLTASTTSGNSFGAKIEAGTNASDAAFRINSASDSGNYFFVRGDGNVGIGTATPGYKLEIVDVTANGHGLHVSQAGTSGNVYGVVSSAYGAATTNTAGYFYAGGATNNISLTIDSAGAGANNYGIYSGTDVKSFFAGNVGIGSSTPGYRLDVQGGQINSSGGLCIAGVCKTNWSQVGGSQWTTTGSNVSYSSGNVGIGTTNPTKALDVVGDINVSGNINAKYQDVAEWVESSQTLTAGTVVVLDQTKSNQVVASSQAYDTRVAGVISLQPGIALGENGAGKVLVATTGRVRIKVDASRGSIQVGDLLVTSDVAGVAMKSQPIDVGGVQIHRPGTLIGKALEPLAGGVGEILALLSMQ